MVAVSDEIPQARRKVIPLSRRRSPWALRWALSLLLLLLAMVALAALNQGVLTRTGQSAVFERLGAAPAADGRLLGHFPYEEVDPDQLVSIAPGQQLQQDAAKALLAMQRGARDEGIDLVVLSAFRSQAVQNRLFFEIKSERNQTARERARVSAPPGYSEHGTGYAVDLGDGAAPASNLSTSFEQTAAFAWLQANAARYQFVLSFPRGNSQGVNYEPSHWRY
ncbi:MAG: M15 family metallopeptidase, partial [Prochlorococcaceae cyanobacterium]